MNDRMLQAGRVCSFASGERERASLSLSTRPSRTLCSMISNLAALLERVRVGVPAFGASTAVAADLVAEQDLASSGRAPHCV
jgi:hypothetical protein